MVTDGQGKDKLKEINVTTTFARLLRSVTIQIGEYEQINVTRFALLRRKVTIQILSLVLQFCFILASLNAQTCGRTFHASF